MGGLEPLAALLKKEADAEVCSALGVALGVVLGSGLVRLVTQTITDLYFVVRVRERDWGPNYLRFGLGASSDLTGNGEFFVGVQQTWQSST